MNAALRIKSAAKDFQQYAATTGSTTFLSNDVTHGSTPLKSDGSMMGRRLAALIGLRDAARRVLQSQNEGWPEANRDQARRTLNWEYDQFVGHYGPINKTTFGETRDETLGRRNASPNTTGHRELPSLRGGTTVKTPGLQRSPTSTTHLLRKHLPRDA